MDNEIASTNLDYIELTGEVVSAYVSNNHVAPSDLPALIASVHATINRLAEGAASVPLDESATQKVTSGQIRKSIRPEGLISFVDGKPYKTLKRHLTKHGLDPVSYRERYGLPSDYPMVSQIYSEKRSSLAKSLGLGQLGGRMAREADATVKKRTAA